MEELIPPFAVVCARLDPATGRVIKNTWSMPDWFDEIENSAVLLRSRFIEALAEKHSAEVQEFGDVEYLVVGKTAFSFLNPTKFQGYEYRIVDTIEYFSLVGDHMLYDEPLPRQ